MKTKSQLSSMLFFVCLGCPASQPKDIQESKNNVSESSVSPATPIEPNKSTYYEPQKVAPAPTPVKDPKNNDILKTAGIIGFGALGLGALYLAHKKLTTKARQDLENLTHNNPNPKDLKDKSETILNDLDRETQEIINRIRRNNESISKDSQQIQEFSRLTREAKTSLEAAAPAFAKLKKDSFLHLSPKHKRIAERFFDNRKSIIDLYLDTGTIKLTTAPKYYYSESQVLSSLGPKYKLENVKLEVAKIKQDVQREIEEIKQTQSDLIKRTDDQVKKLFNEQDKNKIRSVMHESIERYASMIEGYQLFLQMIQDL